MNVDRNIREAELDADTEEDLLRLQVCRQRCCRRQPFAREPLCYRVPLPHPFWSLWWTY